MDIFALICRESGSIPLCATDTKESWKKQTKNTPKEATKISTEILTTISFHKF